MADNNGNNFTNYINTIYDKKSYLDKYGGSFMMFWFILFIFAICYTYLKTISHLKPVRQNWNKHRCNPAYIPFAGIINPQPGKSNSKVVSDNLSDCTTNVLQEIIGFFVKPIYFIINIILSTLKNITEGIQEFRKLMYYLRNKVVNIFKEMYSILGNIAMYFQLILIKLYDTMHKIAIAISIKAGLIWISIKQTEAILGEVSSALTTFLVVLGTTMIITWALGYGASVESAALAATAALEALDPLTAAAAPLTAEAAADMALISGEMYSTAAVYSLFFGLILPIALDLITVSSNAFKTKKRVLPKKPVKP